MQHTRTPHAHTHRATYLEHAQQVVGTEQSELVVVAVAQLDSMATVLRQHHLGAHLDRQGHDLAIAVAGAGADGNNGGLVDARHGTLRQQNTAGSLLHAAQMS